MNTTEQIRNYVRSGQPGLYVLSAEEQRVEAEIRAVAKDTNFRFCVWSVTTGAIDATDQERPTEIPSAKLHEDTLDPMAMLAAFAEYSNPDVDNPDEDGARVIMVARDFHMFLADPNPLIYRKVKDVLAIGKASNRVLIILGCVLKIPAELEKELVLIEFKLPDREQLLVVLESVAKSASIELNGNSDPILDAGSGLTTTEFEQACALSVIECGDIKPEIVSREKGATLKKSGILEVVETKLSLDDIGGIDLYKDHLWSISKCFTKAAKEYGLPSPRPVICCGQPGCAKSMSAMACKNVFNLPLLRIEAGQLFGSLVGESENRWRTAFSTAKAIAPAIIWIDEAEALFSGLQASGKTDGGTTSRVIKAILQDMQLAGEGLFFVFTANDVDQFPDPLIDRCDLWSFELPTQGERESIWKIHIEKRGRKAKKFNLPRLAQLTDGFSGRQIEQVWIKALTLGFNDKEREPTEKDVEEAAKRFVATSVTMKDAIERRRQRLANRAQPASRTEAAAAATGRRLA